MNICILQNHEHSLKINGKVLKVFPSSNLISIVIINHHYRSALIFTSGVRLVDNASILTNLLVWRLNIVFLTICDSQQPKQMSAFKLANSSR
jgi:hypothetical protein